MATITIAREYGSQGGAVALALCELLGYRYFNKRLLMNLSLQVGLPGPEAGRLADEEHRPRTLLDRLFNNIALSSGSGVWAWAAVTVAKEHEQQRMEKMDRLIRAAHTLGNVVIVGHGAQCVLHELPGVLLVRIVAPLEARIARHARRAGLSPDEARAAVEQRDAAAADYVRR